MTTIFKLPNVLALDTNVAVEALAKLNFFIAGTSTPLDTFTDAALTTEHLNPVVADANGQFATIYLQALSYKVDLTDAADVSLPGYPVDNVEGAEGDAANITYTISGGSERTLQSRLEDSLHVEDFGVVGTADDATVMQMALDEGPPIYFPTRIYMHSGLRWPSQSVMHGDGRSLSVFRMVDGANKDSLVTEDFATHTNSGNWFTDTEGVNFGFEMHGIGIDGNKANNLTAGAGIKIYGKQFILDRWGVWDTREQGVFSECGLKGGQHSIDDMPEAQITRGRIRQCEGISYQIRGPHDAVYDRVFVSEGGSDGISVETDGANYNGSGDFPFVHTYANSGVGFISTAAFRAGHLASESNDKEGLVIDASTGGCQIALAHLFKNSENNVGTYFEARIDGTYNTITQGRLQCDFSKGGWDLAGEGNRVLGGDIDGKKSAEPNTGEGTGAKLSDNSQQFSSTIRNFAGTGGRGIDLNTSQSQVDVILLNNKEGYNITSGNKNQFNIIGDALAGQVPTSTPTARNLSETWNIVFDDTDAGKNLLSANRGTAVVLSGNTSIVVTHDLLFTPNVADISVTPNADVGHRFWISSIGATTFTINTSGTVGANKAFSWQIRQ